MGLMAPQDLMFLAIESREHPMHVGGLELFTPPEGAGPGFIRERYEQLIESPEVGEKFRRRPGTPFNTPRNLLWATDDEIDLDYHVQLTALPQPGRIRELFSATSRWHSSLLDRHRPLWEMRIVEGLEDGRFAVYTKVHHALIDGVTALKTLQAVLSDDPEARDCPAPFAPRQRRALEGKRSRFNPVGLAKYGYGIAGDVAGGVPAAARIGWQAIRERDMVLPLRAPKTIFNVPIGGARRFAAQSWSIARIKAVGKASGCTMNDVVLSMCGGALRDYLISQNALPEDPLIAMVPVSLHSMVEDGNGGNAVTAVLTSLGTHRADALERLECVTNSMQQAKRMLTGLSPNQAMAVGAFMVSPLALAPVPGFVSHTPPAFNIVISNVPGPRKPLYWDGARLDGIYPLSIAMDGLALNITLTSNAETLDFGIVGCRKAVPHLQKLLTFLDDALVSLEKQLGLESA
ncbi:wax ester/triacylglycerol synthase family O-acyltransferase [Hoyosella rhizosphaerae]|uniref:Diacylglycerol O-acyltransferase n=1 Tax=Hoyosella rhizosphaerae TaxID=1755582 RepID=A0A916XC26_9ACTN|nr:wax ester/triacylglycerol synthase family O-acyltransferase [Hoyosella rhizosphaerae]MBN4927633.1 wax ester/triacylglycerol synthase family O-acyltransferase [Hoyosella rhizosphaerae]GGC62923.1 diacylglycerol O-acyltransferase [Hoyosella rhizosphaerae]